MTASWSVRKILKCEDFDVEEEEAAGTKKPKVNDQHCLEMEITMFGCGNTETVWRIFLEDCLMSLLERNSNGMSQSWGKQEKGR